MTAEDIVGPFALCFAIGIGLIALAPWRSSTGRHCGTYAPQPNWGPPQKPIVSLWDKEFHLLGHLQNETSFSFTMDKASFLLQALPQHFETGEDMHISVDHQNHPGPAHPCDTCDAMEAAGLSPVRHVDETMSAMVNVVKVEIPDAAGYVDNVISARLTADDPVEAIIDMAENLGLRVEIWQANTMRGWWSP